MRKILTDEQKKTLNNVNQRLRNPERELCNCNHVFRIKVSKTPELIDKYGKFYLTQYGEIVSHHIDIFKFLDYQKEIFHLDGYTYFEDGWVVDSKTDKLVKVKC